jgi:NAD(P)-dependent dehydrogenase (short-subunit alcohol dehydrogenase family)
LRSFEKPSTLREATHHEEHPDMNIEGSVALVTGANRGLGESLVRELLDQGAAKVYAGARDPAAVTVPGALALRLDVTDPASVAEAARIASDVTLVINNAGVELGGAALEASLDAARAEIEVNYLGTLAVARAFAPRLGGGALVNVLSVLSWATLPIHATYAASKSAAWSITRALRTELPDTLVSGVHVGYIDTGMTTAIDSPKHAPEDVARTILQGISDGDEEILVDELSRAVKATLSAA